MGDQGQKWATAAPFVPRGANAPADPSSAKPKVNIPVFQPGQPFIPGAQAVDNVTDNFGKFTVKEFKPSFLQQQQIPTYEQQIPWENPEEEYYQEGDEEAHHQEYPVQEQRAPLNYHLYTSPMAHLSHLPPNVKSSTYFFIEDELREQLLKMNEALLNPIGVSAENVPQEVSVYHSISMLQERVRISTYFRQSTTVYKATSSHDGRTYILRRIDGFRASNSNVTTKMEPYCKVSHPNVVGLKEAFVTKQFGDHSLVFAYDYHPLAQTLMEHLFSQTPLAPLSEKLFWSYVIQIASGIRAIHNAGLSCRVLDLTKILVTSKHRLRLNCLGMPEVLLFDNVKDLVAQQQEDLLAFGNIVVTLACNSLNALQNIPKALDYISRHMSPELKNVVMFLLSKPSPMKAIEDVFPLMGMKLVNELDGLRSFNDQLEGELAKELENGRLARLLCKLGFINERPEFDMDPSWSETGDRYLLKLFRDYVFHQVDENGEPILNLAHVIMCLNKLDAGHPERIMLMSRDELSSIVVSYKDLKRCLEETFSELIRRKR